MSYPRLLSPTALCALTPDDRHEWITHLHAGADAVRKAAHRPPSTTDRQCEWVITH
jgi:hypothetical protein